MVKHKSTPKSRVAMNIIVLLIGLAVVWYGLSYAMGCTPPPECDFISDPLGYAGCTANAMTANPSYSLCLAGQQMTRLAIAGFGCIIALIGLIKRW